MNATARLFVILITALFVPALAAAEQMEAPSVEYRGEMTASQAGRDFNADVFYGGDRFRLDMQSEQGPISMMVVYSEQVAFMVMNSQRMAMRLPMERMQRNFTAAPQNAEFEAVGNEEVNGFETTKYRVTRANPSEDGFEGFAWLTDERIVMRMDGQYYGSQGVSDVAMDLNNLQIGDQPDSLFTVPEGYRVMNMGGRQ